MDPPNQWSNYQQYGRVPAVPPGSLPSQHSPFAGLDQATLSAAGAGFAHNIQSHSALPQRGLNSIPTVNYPLHSSTALSQLLEAMAPHSGGFSTQALQKVGVNVSQNELILDSIRADHHVSVTSAQSSVAAFSQAKASVYEESKEPSLTYSSPVMSHSASLDESSKVWGLSNLLSPSSSNTFATISDVELSNSVRLSVAGHHPSKPPPAHSTTSRLSAIQRNPYSIDGVLPDASSQTGRSDTTSILTPSQGQISTMYTLMDAGRQLGQSAQGLPQTPLSQLQTYSIPAQEIKDLSQGSQGQGNIYYVVTSPSSTTNFAASHLTVANMNYEPLSPATQMVDGQAGDTGFPSTVSLTDLNAIGAGALHPHAGIKAVGSGMHSVGLNQAKAVKAPQQLRSQLLEQLSRGREGAKSHVQQVSVDVGSPVHNSPHSTESPQVSMSSLGSPQKSVVVPSSSIKPINAPIQAMADSSTTAKPKKPRSRKKPAPKADTQKDGRGFINSQQPGFLSSSQGFHGAPTDFQTPTSRSVQQFQQQQQGNEVIMQTQFANASQSSHGLMGLRVDTSNSEGSYQVLSSVGTGQVTPVTEQSHSQSQSQKRNLDSASLIPLNSVRVSEPSATGSNNSESTTMLTVGYQTEQNIITPQSNQYDVHVYSSQPYMEQLVSGQPVRLMSGNLYSDSVHVASGLSAYPSSYTYQTAEGSTIDEAAFSNILMDSGASSKTEQKTVAVVENTLVQIDPPPKASSPVPNPPGTCTKPLDETDELWVFAQPPPELCEKPVPKVSKPPGLPQGSANSATDDGSSVASPHKPPELKLPTVPNKSKSAFQDTFMNFLMGKKQETLSSVTSSTIGEKPQLPKYIPEPRRPPPPPQPAPEPIPSSAVASAAPDAMSEDEDDSAVGAAVKNVPSSVDSDSNDSEGQVQGNYCVQRTKDLTMKITLQNTIKKQKQSRGRPSRGRGGGGGRGRGGEGAKSKSVREPTPPPPRESIGRRAKDKARKKRKYHDSGSSGLEDSDDDKNSKQKHGSGSEYDSDRDPVWTPMEEESKRPIGINFDVSSMLETRPKKGKKLKRGPKPKTGQQEAVETTAEAVTPPAVKPSRGEQKSSTNGGSGRTVHTLSAEDQDNSVVDENYQVGQFVLEKKDLHNYESYPIWRLEQGRMLRKFELFIDNRRMCHRAVSTYSSWVPSMRAGYQPIRVKVVSNKPNAEVVEVMEEYRPTPPRDGSLENQFEDDPLVEDFSVFLQIFLSQSLAPSFLEAIRSSDDVFYLTAMNTINKKINDKLEDIDKRVRWKANFRESMRAKPEMREITRPSLKQSCQACENSSPPTIKSVLFHGPAYDQYLLTDLPKSDSSSQEFLVGKFAAPYITQYHCLHHFKRSLYQRCQSKVHYVRECESKSQNLIDDTLILERCLADRAWVLKIFQDFKDLLEEPR